MSVDVGTCNAGTCVPPAAKACPKSLICSGKACKTSCDADQDCVSGYICVSHTCYPKQTVIDLPFSASLSGTVTSDGKVSSPIQVGDDASKVQSCGFVSFKISDIPKGAYLVYATFVYTVIKDNGKAYDALGDMVAQKVSYSKLERGSFSLSPSGSVTLFDTVPESSHNDDVSSLLQPEINAGAANLQLRLCFSKASNNDSVANFAQFDMSGEPPVLYVKYQLLPL